MNALYAHTVFIHIMLFACRFVELLSVKYCFLPSLRFHNVHQARIYFLHNLISMQVE